MSTSPQATWREELNGYRKGAEALARANLGRARTGEDVGKLIRKLDLIADRNVEAVEHRGKALSPEDQDARAAKCAPGCAYCCHQRVRASIPEVLYVWDYIQANWTADQIEELKRETASYRASFEHEPSRTNLKCPLLKNNLCTVYPNRPLVCRGFLSSDVGKCAAVAEKPGSASVPALYWPYQVALALRMGLSVSAKETLPYSYDVLLGVALSILLEQPNAVERYFHGEDVFRPAMI